MDSFEWNKIAGAVLFPLLVVSGLIVFSDILFHSEAPESPGYVIQVAEAPETGGDGGAAEEATPIGALLASATPQAGEAVARKCTACHSFEEGGGNRVGPALWDTVNRQVASVPGFSYSSALVDFADGGTAWTYEHLDSFLENPKSYVPGTKMSFAGVKDEEDRANLIAYMRSLSSNPAPLPEVTEAPGQAPEEGGDTAEADLEAPPEPAKAQSEVQVPTGNDRPTSGEIGEAPTRAGDWSVPGGEGWSVENR